MKDTTKTQDKIPNYDAQVRNSVKGIPNRELTKDELSKLADMVMLYAQEMTGVELYPYELEFGWRIIYSLLCEDAEEVTALFSRQGGKCLGKGTKVVMYDGSIKCVEDVVIGDELMGDDGGPRKVFSTVVGNGLLFRVIPEHETAMQYVVNSVHVLSLENKKTGDIEDIEIGNVFGVESEYRGIRRQINHDSYDFSIKCEGNGAYYGFVLGGNKRFLLEDGTVTHNTETVSIVVCGCMVLLPTLAKFLDDRRIKKFSKGVWIGIYAPNYEQAGVMWGRMKARMYSDETKVALLDPDVNIDLTSRRENMVLPNGSFVDCGTASPQSKIEGKTYHLILLEEAQDISSSKIRASIHPMAAATAGTLVKIGTCNRVKSDFYEACRRNKRMDVNDGSIRSRYRRHYEYDYTVCQKYNDRYRKYIEKEKVRLGEDSDDFRMKYRLHWLLERGMFINPELFDECGIKESNASLFVDVGRGRSKRSIEFKRPPNVVTHDVYTEGMVAAIDVGRMNSTVVTVGHAFYDMPIQVGDSTRYPLHVVQWLELQGDDHEAQHPQILSFLNNYKISRVIIDATGKGDPIYSRLSADLDHKNIHVEPFIFTAQSKDIGYKVLFQELSAKRLTYPAGKLATRLVKWQKFVNQMHDLEKEWRGQTLVVHKSKDGDDAHDDYPDSLMLLCWAVNVQGTLDIEETVNPFIGRQARWISANNLKAAGGLYAKNMSQERPPRKPRSSHSGRWDS